MGGQDNGTNYPPPFDPGPIGNPTVIAPAPRGEQHSGQVRMAYRLAAEYADRLLHVHSLGWHYFDGTRWVADDNGTSRRAVLAILKDALLASLGDKQLRADVTRCESNAGIEGVLGVASALVEFAATVADLNPDPYLLNCANGTLDLHTLQLRPHDPADRITKVTGAGYDPGAAGPEWDKFLARVLPCGETLGFLQRYVGQALVGTVLEHTLAILTGTGRNGKSKFYEGVAAAFGDYADTAEPDLFMHRDGGHPTGEMDLLGLRWVVVSESDKGRRLAEATVKRLTGGDVIKARRMRQDFVSFSPSHTAALVTNHLPKVSGDDPALWARLRVIPFDVVIPVEERDTRLGDKLALEAEAILAWIVAGWQDYTEQGLAEPDTVLAATAKYHGDSDDVERFLATECFVSPVAHVTVGDLWDRWTSWRMDEGGEEISKRAFGESMDRRGFRADKLRGARIRRGLELVSGGDEL